jgi:hypothetical protein
VTIADTSTIANASTALPAARHVLEIHFRCCCVLFISCLPFHFPYFGSFAVSAAPANREHCRLLSIPRFELGLYLVAQKKARAFRENRTFIPTWAYAYVKKPSTEIRLWAKGKKPRRAQERREDYVK